MSSANLSTLSTALSTFCRKHWLWIFFLLYIFVNNFFYQLFFMNPRNLVREHLFFGNSKKFFTELSTLSTLSTDSFLLKWYIFLPIYRFEFLSYNSRCPIFKMCFWTWGTHIKKGAADQYEFFIDNAIFTTIYIHT